MMRTIIEADFFPPAVDESKDPSPAVAVDHDADAAHSVEPSPNKASGSSTSEVSDV
jgi:hypothetical protein